MATIKSYSDLQQSRKLAEILPLESADMNYSNMCYKGVMYSNPYRAGLSSYNDASRMNQENIDFYLKGVDYKGIIAWDVLPCWSLAALLGVLPQGEYEDTDLCFGGYEGDKYIPEWFCSYEQQEPFIFEISHADNPVDACVAMIEKLHELKML